MKQDQEAQLIARVAGNIFSSFYEKDLLDPLVLVQETARQAVDAATEIVRLAQASAADRQHRRDLGELE